MKPVSILHIKAHDGLWLARQEFLKLGKYKILVYAVGFTRAEALQRFQREKAWAEEPHEEPFKALFDFLWAVAGLLDILIKFLGRFKALLKPKV